MQCARIGETLHVRVHNVARAVTLAAGLSLAIIGWARTAEANEGLKAVAQEIADKITRCQDKAKTSGIAVVHPARVTDIIISLIDTRNSGLSEKIAADIHDDLLRDISAIKTLKVLPVMLRNEITNQERDSIGPEVLKELHQKFSALKYKFIVFPRVLSVVDGVISLRFLIADREDLDCQDVTSDAKLRFKDNNILGPGEVLETELMSQAGREFLRNASIIRRIIVLPTTVGTAILNREIGSQFERQLIYHLGQPLPDANQRSRSVQDIRRLGSGEFLPGGPQEGDWLAQIMFVMEPNPEMRIAIWARDGTKTFRQGGEVRISRPREFKTAVDNLGLRIEVPRPVGPTELPRFALQVQQDNHVYCLAYSLDGDATFLVPAPDAGGRTTASRLVARPVPYRFPEDFVSGSLPAQQRPAQLHDGVIACWSTFKGLADDVARAWTKNTAISRAKKDPNAARTTLKGDVDDLVGELRKLGDVAEAVVAFPVSAGAAR